MNFQANIAETYNYDAWGRRRNPETWTYNNVPEPQLTRVGYTGHEHWDELGLINMTGRMYDPRLARFLSPDPYVQMPDNTQNLNRYSYCLNNPLMYTDPSGEFLLPALAVGAFLLFTEPGYEIQKMVSPVAVHVDVHLGSHQKGLGVDVSLGVPKILPVSYRAHYGATYYWETYGGQSGWEKRQGGEWAINGYMFGVPGSITYSGTRYMGINNQTTNTVTVGNPFINIAYENDTEMLLKLPGVPKYDGGDRYRTAGVRVRAWPFEVGLNLHTGMAGGADGLDATGTGTEGDPRHFTGGDIDEQSHGILYIGFGPIRIGADYEDIRHTFQNRMAHDHFWTKNYGEAYPWVLPIWERKHRFYWYFGTGTGNSMW